ncbi:hypothetical protein AOCH_001019 [Aspergillus ochraceoroseus]|uniref:Zn(2)-C6 fungal-type domain-containing protein n=1 Tax=Aspergillus ochraceoroseus TaxID=138278 RepID=A0A0F8WKI8_9EURO|nr:hypothetical protein AOCH_001019 [Aspergillus ochraceoroseus]
MSALQPEPQQQHTQAARSPRVLACILCQQRKVKCNRKFPCTNCVKSKAQCVPADQVPRRRKRRFPEKELLDRLRQYETLLRQNDIQFEPLHKDPTGDNEPPNARVGAAIADAQPDNEGETDWSSPFAATVQEDRRYEAKNFWNIIKQTSPESDNSDFSSDEIDEKTVKSAWDQVYGNNDPLFGSRKTAVDLSALHPQPAQIFRLWQIYLDNIIEAISNQGEIKSTLETLMFSIYCVSILSISPEDCDMLLGTPKQELLSKYQFACQQALINCGFLRSDNRDCLVAFFLYLVSIRPATDPRSLASMLGIAMRMAHRMGLHSEASCARYPPLEAEMRRRLWWSLVIFDNRIGEMVDYRNTSLTPLWDCRIPLNVNDFDLRPEMKESPVAQAQSTEALFVVLRSAMGDFVRQSPSHLDFSCPAMKPLARGSQQNPASDTGDLGSLEATLEDTYLQFCNPEIPLHLISIWMTRGYLAKCRLVEYYSRHSSGPQTEEHRDMAISHAIRTLECDINIMSSPLTKGYQWLLHFHFPFPAFIHILHDLRRRPLSKYAEYAWDIMSEVFAIRAMVLRLSPNLFFKTFKRLVLLGWEARETALIQLGKSPVPPTIVTAVMEKAAQHAANSDPDTTVAGTNMDNTGPVGSTPIDYAATSFPGGEDICAGVDPWMSLSMAELAPGNVEGDQEDWFAMNWTV